MLQVFTNFSFSQIVFFLFGTLFLLSSLVCHLQRKSSVALVFLFLAAFCIFCFSSLLDPFLNLWDERFHALVAKNLIAHPLKPTLYENPVVNMAYDRWDRSIIWLHKQPLFLWQISLSYQLFGYNEFGVRFPSVLACSLLVIITYRTGKILVDQNVGYFAAFLLTGSNYLFELISGNQMVDHNDVIFFFYVSASIWTWLEYISSKNKGWLILIGIFSAFAILTKWLVGLLVYSGWSLYILLDKQRRADTHDYFDFLLSIIVTSCVVLPWQILILKWYPTEANLAFHYNTDHFLHVIEGHNGPWWYHLGNLQYIYGKFSIFTIPLGLLLLFRSIRLDRPTAIAFISFPIIIFLFYSIAATKMISFPFVTSLPLFIGLGCLMDYSTRLFQTFKLPTWILNSSIFMFFMAIFIFNIRPLDVIANHSSNSISGGCRKVLVYNKSIFLKCKTILPHNALLFNLKGRSYIDCMFYSGLPSYNFVPSYEQYLNLINPKGKYSIVIFNIIKNDCPEYLRKDNSIIFIKDTVQSCD